MATYTDELGGLLYGAAWLIHLHRNRRKCFPWGTSILTAIMASGIASLIISETFKGTRQQAEVASISAIALFLNLRLMRRKFQISSFPRSWFSQQLPDAGLHPPLCTGEPT